MRDRNVLILLWSLPVALGLHVFEEFVFPGGLKQWIKSYKPGKPKSDFYYFMINAAGIVGMILLALNATHVNGIRVYLCCVAMTAGNAASHIRGTIQMKQYCPGTISGSVLLLPLGIISYWYILEAGAVDLPSAIVSICAGIVLGFYVWGMDIRKEDRDHLTRF